MSKLNLTFDSGAPIDATKLMQLVDYVNELDSKTLQIGTTVSGIDLANQNSAKRMVSGTHTAGKVTLSGEAVAIDVPYSSPLTGVPSAVLVTLETTTKNADMSYYLKGGSVGQSSFTLMISRVAGVTSKGTTTSSVTYDNVKIHYLALAKLD